MHKDVEYYCLFSLCVHVSMIGSLCDFCTVFNWGLNDLLFVAQQSYREMCSHSPSYLIQFELAVDQLIRRCQVKVGNH